MSGAGIFTSALRDALLAGEIDIAVHSLKDLPVQTPHGLVLAAVPARADAADLLVTLDGRGLADLPAGARIGTGSPRRAALLRAARPDVEVVPIRGNVDTRLRLLEGNGLERLDGVVLAAAGLSRLGRTVKAERLVAPVMLPAPGQGALAVEMRAGDPAVAKVAGLDDVQTRRCVCAERAVLARLGAGCTAAVAALAVPATAEQGRLARGTPDPDQARLALRAVVLAVDGSRRSSAEAVGPAAEPEQLGAAVGDQLLAAGAAELLTDVHGPPWQPSPRASRAS
jgi:hydroxymethylbilane synthase